ncbi:MAG TPA: hypothetical protein PLI62_01540, partial [Spirochaetota bacterium]|nr:hypothetical protein [Spirochaetota bacterium]
EKNRELAMKVKEAQDRLEVLLREKSKSENTIQSLNEQLQQQKKLTEEALKSPRNETKAP